MNITPENPILEWDGDCGELTFDCTLEMEGFSSYAIVSISEMGIVTKNDILPEEYNRTSRSVEILFLQSYRNEMVYPMSDSERESIAMKIVDYYKE